MTAEPSVRDRVMLALSIEGAFCGDCSTEPGNYSDCPECTRWLGIYADALAAAGLLAGEPGVESVQVARLAFILRDVDQPYQQSAEDVAHGLYRADVRVKVTP